MERLIMKKTSLIALLALAGLAVPVTAQAKSTLKIGYLPITDHLTVIAKGQTESADLDFQPVKFGSWPELAEALKAGAVDGAFALAPMGITLRQKGAPLKAVLLGHRNGSVVTVKADGPVHTPADLKGKTIAIPSRFSTHNILLRRLLGKAGIDAAQDVKIIELAPPEMVNALATGRIDAFIVAEPFGAQAELQKIGRVLVLSKDIWPDHICCVLNLRQEAIDRDPAAARALVAALTRAGHGVAKNPAAAARASKPFLGQKPEVIEHVLTTPKGRVTYDRLQPELKDFEAIQDALIEYKIQKDRIDLTTYVDDRLAKEAAAAK
jgi:NitT/TauT family transport system substrate-binding protein